MAHLLTVNTGVLRPIPSGKNLPSGIDKRPHDGPVEVRAPGSKADGLGSGLVGDQIGDHRHHGGDAQAVYAYDREELDDWEKLLGRSLHNGAFGENLTTSGLVVSDAVIGERWRVGAEVELQVTGPRIPCGTLRAHIATRGWLKTFTATARSGAYLCVVKPGTVVAGDEITVVHRPSHAVLVSHAFRALTLEPDLLPDLLAAGADLDDELREMAQAGRIPPRAV
ncbi:MOSC domain-containing protein [Lapillicoccus sp.]|uniref:MOSC domain-containing protein n=1 Tax=Lapillicoccus sp. TaxID=1909287 RepID=UPI0039838524